MPLLVRPVNVDESGRNVIKTEVNRSEASVCSLDESVEPLNGSRFVADDGMVALRKQIAILMERIEELREEADSLNASVLDRLKRSEGALPDLGLLGAEDAEPLADLEKEPARSGSLTGGSSSLSSSAGGPVARVSGTGPARDAEARAVGRRIKVVLLIFAVVGGSLLAAVSVHASNSNGLTTITETYFSEGTSTVTVTSQFTVTSQASPAGSGLLMPVFGRWVTPSVTVQVNSNSSLESWIFMRAVETWNGAEGNFTGGTPPYELTEVEGEAQITVNFVSTLPASLDGSTSCQQTNLPTGSWVNGIFTSCVIQVSNEIFTVGEEQLAYRLALHELGHALGLGTLSGSTDLMDGSGWQQATGISTLDLYALQTLSTVGPSGVAPSFIALNGQVPYRVVTESLT